MSQRKRFDSSYVPVVDCTGDVLRTKQSFKKECDINVIMGKYLKSGNVDHVAKYGGRFEFAQPTSFHEAMNVVTKAEQMFADLPSEVRRRFGNSPADFMEFAIRPENLDEMRRLRLAPPAARAAPAPAVAPAPGTPTGVPPTVPT